MALYSAYAAADHDAMDELLAVDFVGHGIGPGLTDDAEGMKQSSVAMHAALTDCSNKIEQMIAEGDMVAVRFTTRAVHSGELFGVPPTGKRVTMSGIEWYRLSNHKIVEFWGEYNMGDLFGADA